MNGANRGVVNATPRLLPDKAHFTQHPKTVARQTHRTAFVVIPTHRHFLQSQPCAKSEIQQFDVKSEAIDRCGFDQRPAHAHAKRLEATLRIPERQTRCQAHREIENASALLASPRLMHADEVSIQRARTKRHVKLSVENRIDELRRFSDWG